MIEPAPRSSANGRTAALAELLAQQLTADPQTLAALARAVGRAPRDGGVRNALARLADQGRAKKTTLGGWRRPDAEGANALHPLPAEDPLQPRKLHDSASFALPSVASVQWMRASLATPARETGGGDA